MNPYFPHFDFDSWIKEYYLTFTFFSHVNADEELIASEREVFEEMKEAHSNQIHIPLEDSWSLSDMYADVLHHFNIFMALVTTDNVKKENIIEHFLKYRFPGYFRLDHAAKCMVTGTKHYTILNSIGTSYKLKSETIIENIDKLLTKLNINVNG